MENQTGKEQRAAFLTKYRSKVKEVLIKMRLAFSMPEMEDDVLNNHLENQAIVFTEILEPELPMEFINQSYLKAMRERVSTFPLVPNEMIAAFNSLRAENTKPAVYECVFCKFEREVDPSRPCKIHNKG